MPYVDWNGHINETRKERQRRERIYHMTNRTAMMRTTGMMTALSISSLLIAGFTGNTMALLTAKASAPTIQFSAADHFPSWYAGLNSQLDKTVAHEDSLLRDMCKIQISPINESECKSLNNDVNQLGILEGQAAQTYQLIDQAAQSDEQRYIQVAKDPANSQADIASYQRVAAFGQSALNVATPLYDQSKQDWQDGNEKLANATKEYQAEQLAHEQSVLQSVYGDTVNHAVYGGTVTSSVYGQTVISSVYGETVMPAVNQIINHQQTQDPITDGNSQKSLTVTDVVYGQVYGSMGQLFIGTLGPSKNS